MTLPTLAKTWSHSINNRITPFVSLNDTMATFLYGLKNWLVATMGYTVKFSCDGTTGPASGADTTDRWTNKTKCTTRATVTAGAQSWIVLVDGNGVQIMLAYMGASDDICRVTMSVGALYTVAGTATFEPTATDESVIVTGTTIINATASADRVWHASATTDKKMFRCFTYRQSTMIQSFGVELVTSTTVIGWAPPVVGWNSANGNYANASASAGGALAAPNGAAGAAGAAIARIGATNIALGGGGEMYLNSAAAFAATAPALNAACPIVPICYACATASFDGKLGNRIDAWFAHGSGIAQGDILGTNQFYIFGTAMYPGDGATTPQIA